LLFFEKIFLNNPILISILKLEGYVKRGNLGIKKIFIKFTFCERHILTEILGDGSKYL